MKQMTIDEAVEYFRQVEDQLKEKTHNLDGLARKEELFARACQEFMELPKEIRDAVLASLHP